MTNAWSMINATILSSVPKLKSALPKRKFNVKTLKGLSIIRRSVNIQLPNRISKVICVWKSTLIIFCRHFRVTISRYSVPRSKSALPKQKFKVKTFNGVSLIRRLANIQLPNRISKVIHIVKSFFIIFWRNFRVTISILSERATVEIRVTQTKFQL
jgi:hypothetical protein